MVTVSSESYKFFSLSVHFFINNTGLESIKDYNPQNTWLISPFHTNVCLATHLNGVKIRSNSAFGIFDISMFGQYGGGEGSLYCVPALLSDDDYNHHTKLQVRSTQYIVYNDQLQSLLNNIISDVHTSPYSTSRRQLLKPQLSGKISS